VKISVSFFAQSREITGKNKINYEIPEGERVSFLIKILQSQFHDLLVIKIMVAVNSEYVENDYVLHESDQVAIIPPVSGG
jgi:molybdopterin synthase sulfur carrier subunit